MNSREFQIGTFNTTPIYTRAEFVQVTTNYNKVLLKIGKSFYFCSHSILREREDRRSLEQLQKGDLLLVKLLFETNEHTHNVSTIYLLDFDEATNPDLNVGELFNEDETDFKFRITKCERTSNPSLFLLTIKDSNGDEQYIRHYQDVSDILDRDLLGTFKLRQSKNHVRRLEDDKIKCYVVFTDKRYIDQNGNQIEKLNAKVYKPCIELSLYSPAIEDKNNDVQ